jgi:hypothetical protein
MVDACELLRDPRVQTQNPRVQGVKDVTLASWRGCS